MTCGTSSLKPRQLRGSLSRSCYSRQANVCASSVSVGGEYDDAENWRCAWQVWAACLYSDHLETFNCVAVSKSQCSTSTLQHAPRWAKHYLQY